MIDDLLWTYAVFDRTMCCPLPCHTMGCGLFQGPRTVAYSSGTPTVQLCSVCSKDTRILVGNKNQIMSVDLRRCPVISIDLSPAGNILATGSGDWQARICAFLSNLSICRHSLTCYSRELPNHLALIFGSIGRITIIHLRVALFSCFSRVVNPVLCPAALFYIYTNQYLCNLCVNKIYLLFLTILPTHAQQYS